MAFNAERVGRASWRDVLGYALARDEGREQVQTTARVEEMPDLGLEHLHYAINRVAKELPARNGSGGGQGLGRDRYSQLRRELARADGGRHRKLARLEQLLPTADQLERIELVLEQEEHNFAGSGEGVTRARERRRGVWLRVLQRAGRPELEPKPSGEGTAPTGPRGLAIAYAINAFLEANGGWPSHHKLEAFAREVDIVIAERDRSRSWQSLLEDVAQVRSERGKGSPPTHTRHRGREFALPPEGIPGAPRRGGPHPVDWTEERCLEVLRVFSQLVDATPGLRPTQKTYNALAPERGWPSSSRFPRYGGFRRLLKRAEAK